MMRDLQDALADLVADRSSGATALASRGLDMLERLGLAATGDDDAVWSQAVELTRALDRARPCLAAIGAQAILALSRAERLKHEGYAARPALIEAARRERDTLGQADDLVCAYAAAELPEGEAIVTSSFSVPALRTIVALRPRLVWISEGGRWRDGARGASWLAARGVEVEMLPDASLPGVVKDADCVLVGADQVLCDGGLVSRAGTLALALAASYYGKSFFAVCHRLDLAGRTTAQVEHEPALLGEDVPFVRSRAPLFEVTPAGLVHGIVTESGRLSAEQAGQLGLGLARLRLDLLGE